MAACTDNEKRKDIDEPAIKNHLLDISASRKLDCTTEMAERSPKPKVLRAEPDSTTGSLTNDQTTVSVNNTIAQTSYEEPNIYVVDSGEEPGGNNSKTMADSTIAANVSGSRGHGNFEQTQKPAQLQSEKETIIKEKQKRATKHYTAGKYSISYRNVICPRRGEWSVGDIRVSVYDNGHRCPLTRLEMAKLLSPKVSVTDIGNNLLRNGSYCVECRRLLSRPKDYALHRRSIHGDCRTNVSMSQSRNYKCQHSLGGSKEKSTVWQRQTELGTSRTKEKNEEVGNNGGMSLGADRVKVAIREKKEAVKRKNTAKFEEKEVIKKLTVRDYLNGEPCKDSHRDDVRKTTHEITVCLHCNINFLTQEKLISHMYEVLNKKYFKCQQCAAVFATEERLGNHVSKCCREIGNAASNSTVKLDEKKSLEFDCEKQKVPIPAAEVASTDIPMKRLRGRPLKHEFELTRPRANRSAAPQEKTVKSSKIIASKVTGVLNTAGKVTGVLSTAGKVTSVLNTAGKLTGVPNTARKVTGVPNTARKVTGVPNTARKVTGVSNTARKVTGVPKTARKVTGVPNTARKVTGVSNTARKVTGVPKTARKVTGVLNTARKVTGVPKTARKVTGVPNNAGKGKRVLNTARKALSMDETVVFNKVKETLKHYASAKVNRIMRRNILPDKTIVHGLFADWSEENVMAETSAETIISIKSEKDLNYHPTNTKQSDTVNQNIVLPDETSKQINELNIDQKPMDETEAKKRTQMEISWLNIISPFALDIDLMNSKEEDIDLTDDESIETDTANEVVTVKDEPVENKLSTIIGQLIDSLPSEYGCIDE